MINFSIPCDFTEQTLRKIVEINDRQSIYRITEVYGQASIAPITVSGRGLAMLKKITIAELEQYIKMCETAKIKFNYTINASCMNNSELYSKSVYCFLENLYNIGVRTYTVALPSLFYMIKEIHPNVEIKASAICEIDCLTRAIEFCKLGADRIVLDPDITRDFYTIEKIAKKLPDRVELIVNNLCVKKCPYKMFHYNSEAHSNDSRERYRFYYDRCSFQKATEYINYMKLNWIRPEDIHLYIESGVTNYKIQGRNVHDGEKILKTLTCYFDNFYDGNLLELLTLYTPYNIVQPYINNIKLNGFIKKFFEERNFCSEQCDECNYCNYYLLKSCRIDELIHYKEIAKKLYYYRKE